MWHRGKMPLRRSASEGRRLRRDGRADDRRRSRRPGTGRWRRWSRWDRSLTIEVENRDDRDPLALLTWAIPKVGTRDEQQAIEPERCEHRPEDSPRASFSLPPVLRKHSAPLHNDRPWLPSADAISGSSFETTSPLCIAKT